MFQSNVYRLRGWMVNVRQHHKRGNRRSRGLVGEMSDNATIGPARMAFARKQRLRMQANNGC